MQPGHRHRAGSRVTVLLEDASGAGLGPAMVQALNTAGYPKVQLSTLPSSDEHSQVFTQTDVEVAQQLADQLNLPRLQGERFAVSRARSGCCSAATPVNSSPP